MDKNTSIYLDIVRFLGAFTVMVCHVDLFMLYGVFPALDHIGFEGVGAFFALSGFLIGFVTDTKEKDFRTYFISRAARLYSVVIPCLALAFVLDAAGRHFAPIDYGLSGSNLHEVKQILFSLSFLNQSWILSNPITPGSDGVFWTLCLEAPYYAIFGIAFYLRGIWRLLLLGLCCSVIGPWVLMGFPLWLAGLLAYRIGRHVEISRFIGQVILLSTVAIWIAFEIILWRLRITHSFAATFQISNQLIAAGGLIFAASIVGFRASGIRLHRIGPVVTWLAGATFTLYLLHSPIICLLNTALPQHLPRALRFIALVGTTFCVVLVVAEFTERRKHVWRKKIELLYAAAETLVARLDARWRPGKQMDSIDG